MILFLIGLAYALPLALVTHSKEDGVDVGGIAERATIEVGMTLKELALTCQYPDASTLCRGFKGQAPLDLWHLRHAPYRWWQLFLMKLSSELIKFWFDSLVGDFHMVKADLKADDKKGRIA